MREDGCLICGCSWKPLNYKINGIKMCEECYIKRKIEENLILKRDSLTVNTFRVVKNDNYYFGVITGYQCRKGYEDKFYLHMNINEENFSIWLNDWFTEKEIAKSCDGWNIDIDELIG
jgi:hypothetical protein